MTSLQRDWRVWFGIVVTWVSFGCTAGAMPVEQKEPNQIGLSRQTEETTAVRPDPSSWERRLDGYYENRGVSKIEKWVNTFVLTTYCNGIHSVYIQGSKSPNLDDYLGKFVRAQYTYVEVKNYNVKCIRAPCGPLIERRIVINNLSEIVVSQDDLGLYRSKCSK